MVGRPVKLTRKALRAENVEYIVAPYEADAQLCFLEREGIVDGIITEDSDLLVFGCKQVRRLPRMNLSSAFGEAVCNEPLANSLVQSLTHRSFSS